MRDALELFPEQFLFEPKIMNEDTLVRDRPMIICGMGGSHLSADIFALLSSPGRIRLIHSDYGLPRLSDKEAASCLFVMSSYSGNTEEVLESYRAARDHGYAMCAMAVGGKLLELAAADGIPYIQFPSVGIQPRAALGYGVVALGAFAGEQKNIFSIDTARARSLGESLAEKLPGRIPLVYASGGNAALAQNWKIKFCENTKIPAFWNVIPELNHNEMTGFDAVDATKSVSAQFSVIMLLDVDDHPRNQQRMKITRELYEARNIPVHTIELWGASRAEKILNCLLVADWASVCLGEFYGVEVEQVPMVEEFKKMIA